MASTNLPKTCRALRQNVYAQTPVVEEMPTPRPVPGAVILKIERTAIISYMKRIYDGTRKCPYPTPLTLGTAATGRVAALPIDSTSLQLGQLVLFDGMIRSRDQPSDIFLSSIMSGYSDGSRKLMHDAWRDGTYAEYAAVESV